MEEKELKEIFEDLEKQGWEPQLCDTAVPYYENAVMCGDPADVGDLMACEEELFPKKMLKLQPEFVISVTGDSMKDANILPGDKVKVCVTQIYSDGDIVLVSIDDEYTLKTYFTDEDGRPWLVPQNDKYEPFPLNEYQKNRVCGVVTQVIKTNPRIDFNSCKKRINKAKQKVLKPKEITKEQAMEVIKSIAPAIGIARLWFAVFRVMMDMKVVDTWDYDAFCVIVKNAVPNHQHLPSRLELQRLAVKSFTKPFVLWDENDAPVQGKRFNTYVSFAKKTKELLDRI